MTKKPSRMQRLLKAQTVRAEIERRAVMEAVEVERKCAADAEAIVSALDVENPLHGAFVEVMSGALARNNLEAARARHEQAAARDRHQRLVRSAELAADRIDEARRAAERAAERRRLEALTETRRR